MKNMIIIFLSVAIFGLISFGIYSTKNKSVASPNQKEQDSNNFASDLKITISGVDHIRGNSDAVITLVGYSDFQCPYCVRFHPTMKKIADEYPDKVRWVYRYYPLPFHQAARGAAVAAEAAGRQGKFWEYSDKIIENSEQDGTGLGEADLIKYAEELGLDMAKFKNDLTDKSIDARIERDITSGNNLKVKGTPATYLIDKNGQVEPLAGALPYEQLKAKIDAVLKND